MELFVSGMYVHCNLASTADACAQRPMEITNFGTPALNRSGSFAAAPRVTNTPTLSSPNKVCPK